MNRVMTWVGYPDVPSQLLLVEAVGKNTSVLSVYIVNEVVNWICYVCSTLVKYSNRTVTSYLVLLPSLASYSTFCSSSLFKLLFSTSQSLPKDNLRQVKVSMLISHN